MINDLVEKIFDIKPLIDSIQEVLEIGTNVIKITHGEQYHEIFYKESDKYLQIMDLCNAVGFNQKALLYFETAYVKEFLRSIYGKETTNSTNMDCSDCEKKDKCDKKKKRLIDGWMKVVDFVNLATAFEHQSQKQIDFTNGIYKKMFDSKIDMSCYIVIICTKIEDVIANASKAQAQLN